MIIRRFLVLATLFAFGLTAMATPAGAHARLVSTEPANTQVLASSPDALRLTFNEPVEISLGAIRVYRSSGDRVAVGEVRQGSNASTFESSVTPLEPDTYVAAWRATSVDGHPIRGAFAFQVGNGAPVDTTELSQKALAENGDNAATSAAFSLNRFAEYASLMLLAGGLVMALWIWRAGFAALAVRRYLWILAAVAAASTVLGIGLQGAYGGGLAVADAFRPETFEAVFDTRFGRGRLLRLVALAAVAGLLLAVTRRSGAKVWRWLAIVIALALLAPFSFAGHAGGGQGFSLPMLVDLVHLVAASLWLGGLGLLLVGLASAPHLGPVGAITSFSKLALPLVAIVIVSGTTRAWQELETLDALFATDYGRLLIVKALLVGGLILAAAGARRRLMKGKVTEGEGSDASPRRQMLIEASIAAAVVAVTSVLVTFNPTAETVDEPFAAYLEGDGMLVQLIVDPPNVGPAEIHFYSFTENGARILELSDLDATISLPSKEVEALTIPLYQVAPGHFTTSGFPLPLEGDWQMEAKAVTSDLRSVVLTASIPVA